MQTRVFCRDSVVTEEQLLRRGYLTTVGVIVYFKISGGTIDGLLDGRRYCYSYYGSNEISVSIM
jgi:hypothetical protein